jgi:hypothetical protein
VAKGTCIGRLGTLGTLLVAWLGSAGGTANGAPRPKPDRTRFSTMAEVLKALGKPESIAPAKLYKDGINDYLSIALVYAKPHNQKFFISRKGEVLAGKWLLLEPKRTGGSPTAAAGQRDTVADVCKRLGNPDEVWGESHERWGRTPLAVQLTFNAAKRRYEIGGDGYVLAIVQLSDDDLAWRGENVADAFRDFGKPDVLMDPDDFSTKFEEGTPIPTLVMMYLRFRNRRWFVAGDGTVIGIVRNKLETLEIPLWAPLIPEHVHRESIADRVNRLGKPDRIEAVTSPKTDREGNRTVIVLTYRRLDQRVCYSMDGYLLDDQTGCPGLARVK